MNPVTEAVHHIKRRIPRAILEKALLHRYQGRYGSTETIDSRIKEEIIYGIAIPDCNMSGGISMIIDLSTVRPRIVTDQELNYIIPMELTKGKRIVSALHVDVNSPTAAGGGSVAGAGSVVGGSNSGRGVEYCERSHSPLMALAQKSLNASAGGVIPYVSNTNVEIIGNNALRVTNFPRGIIYRSLSCFVENDADPNNISARSIPDFRQLCLLAAKAWIYNEILIELGEDEIRMGAILGAFKEKVLDYRDADAQYDDFLENEMGAVLFMNDGNRFDEYMDAMIPPY